MISSDSEYCQLAIDIIDMAKKKGATAVEVDIGASSGFSVGIRKSSVETIEHSNGKDLGITVYFGNNTGSAGTSDLSAKAIDTALEKACYIAKFTSPDIYAGLADPDLMAYDYADIDLLIDNPWDITVEQAIELAKNAESKGFLYDKRINNSDGVSIETFRSIDIYANSHGFCGTTIDTRHDFSCSFIAKDSRDMQRDYYYTVASDHRDMEEANTVALKAAKRTVDRMYARKLSTRTSPVIFNSEIASSLIGNFARAIAGSNIYHKSSFLLDSLDKQVFASNISITENPHIPKALGSTVFDDEGVKVYSNNVVVDGILQRYILDSYAARKLNMKTTGNAGGIHNWIIKADNTDRLDLNDLLREMGTGLLVTELMGDGVNIVTGDYSRGAFGYWVENGEIKYPVTGITIAGNLRDMLLNIVNIGTDIDYRGSILTGSTLISKITIAGN